MSKYALKKQKALFSSAYHKLLFYHILSVSANRNFCSIFHNNLSFFNFGTIFHCYHISCMNSDKPFASQLKFIIS